MIRVDIRETVRRPIGEVFDRLVDIDGYDRWLPRGGVFVGTRKESDGPVGPGTRYSDRTLLGTAPGEVVEFARPRRVVFHYTFRLLGRTVMEGWPGYTLDPEGDEATRVHHHAHARLYGPARLLRPIVQRMADAERRRTVDALKRSLERG